MSRFLSLPGLQRPFPVIGVVHLLPLPGSPRWGGRFDAVLDRARRDQAALEDGGVDAVIVENYGDVPFFPGPVPAVTIASMSRVVSDLAGRGGGPLGVNVLRNDAAAAMAIAVACGAAFIRVNVHVGTMVTDQGLIEGRAWETVRLRQQLGSDVKILADVLVKHATPLGDPDAARMAADAVERAAADGLIVTGTATGARPDRTRIEAVRRAVDGIPVLIGSGLDEVSLDELVEVADGAIVGSAFEQEGRAGSPVEPARVRKLVAAIRARSG